MKKLNKSGISGIIAPALFTIALLGYRGYVLYDYCANEPARREAERTKMCAQDIIQLPQVRQSLENSYHVLKSLEKNPDGNYVAILEQTQHHERLLSLFWKLKGNIKYNNCENIPKI